jgi:thioredoxin-related protein
MKKLPFIAMIALSTGLIIGCSSRTNEALAQTGPTIAFSSDFKGSVDEAKSSHKPILMTFHTASCGWCRRMEDVTFRDTEVIRLSKQFVNVRIDADEESNLASSFGADGYPYTVVVSPSGKIVGSIVGYVEPNDFAARLKVALTRPEARD